MSELAQAGGLALVAAMATDAWQMARSRAVALFRHRAPENGAALEGQLVRHAGQVEQGGDRTREMLAGFWQSELEELLTRSPEATADVRALVDEVRAALPAAQGQWVQNNSARGGGQVFAVLHGNQTVHATTPPGVGPSAWPRPDTGSDTDTDGTAGEVSS